ncbi:unnamed protein product [Paramecium primaurelia]|uniref:Protein kinase domain-containing protein n=1 Tax=Paramecium primaurelia TaxID=5886 RepID=A0A8S1PDI5_PARPR|nr:unnamed protein product [Paramecium primaurelia]
MGALCDNSSHFLMDFNKTSNFDNENFRFKEMDVLTNRIDNKFKIIHGILTFRDEKVIEQLKKKTQHANSLNIHHWLIKNDDLHVYFDYPEPISQIDNFEHLEVWKLINHITKILSLLQDLKMHYCALNPNGIFRVYTLQQKYVYKIADSFLFRPLYMKYYQSPTNYYQHEQIEYFKSDVFALGLVCLYCLGLKEPKIFFKQKQFDFKELQIKIKELNLPEYLNRFLDQTLIEQDIQRPNCQQLYCFVLKLNEEYKIQIENIELKLYNHEFQQQTNQNKQKVINDGEKVEILNPEAPFECTHYDLSTWCHFIGRVANGKRNGKGELKFKNGCRFIGTFINGLANGTGIFYYGQQEIIGYWRDDIFMK